jgi:hypothetical protein
MLSRAAITSRDPEGLQAVRVFEEAYDQVKLDHDGARTLNNRGDELKVRLSKLIAGLSVPVRGARHRPGGRVSHRVNCRDSDNRHIR